MVRDVSPVDGVPGDVRVEAARDARDADEFTEVNGLFVARGGGEPVGVGHYALAGTTAVQMGGVVLPAFRKRGIYRALVAARLADAAARGATLATCLARTETSAPRLAKLGFEVVCGFPVFRSPASAGK